MVLVIVNEMHFSSRLSVISVYSLTSDEKQFRISEPDQEQQHSERTSLQ